MNSNGLTEDQVVGRPAEIEQLELFMHNFPRMVCLDLFGHLRKLKLIQQKVKAIRCLETLVHLEELWLAEMALEKIEGLATLVELRRLYLHGNRIYRIEGLHTLTRLTTLWLAQNKIRRIEGLENIETLTELNLASNEIDQIGDNLLYNQNLANLNLSANKIGCFKEVCCLARLPHLVSLSFNDPHWGENPIATLCNYQTYVLFNLPQLRSLDMMRVPDETKQIAGATYMKKKMYYNMKIKTLRRNATNVIRRGHEGKQRKIGKANLTLNLLIRQKKGIQRELECAARGIGKVPAPEVLAQFGEKLAAVQGGIERKGREVDEAEVRYHTCKEEVYENTEAYVRRMLIELETGGNIRLEDGKPSDLWYSSCVDLVNSRFSPSDFHSAGISGLSVTRVTRIHNRFLRNRFEDQLDALVDTNDNAYKRSLEYLFYGENPKLPGELKLAVEDGFRNPADYAALGLDGAVCLTNSISLADLPRVQAAGQGRPGGDGPAAPGGVRGGHILIAKVYLGKCTQETATAAQRKGIKDVLAGGESTSRVTKDLYPEYNAVFRARPNDPKQRLWYIFDPSLVLPEYIVEYEYTFKHGSSLTDIHSMARNVAVGKEIDDKMLQDFGTEMCTIGRPLRDFLMEAIPDAVKLPEDPRYQAILNMPPVVPGGSKTTVMTREELVKATGEKDPACAEYVNFHGNSIRRIEGLEQFVHLKRLVLSFNEIQRIEGICDLPNLEVLELGYNLIKKVEGLKGLMSLKTLELNNNLVFKLEDINVLKKYVPQLEHLSLRNKAICENKAYRSLVLRRMTSLVTLDGAPVAGEAGPSADEASCSLTVQLIKDNAFYSRRTTWSVAGRYIRNKRADGDGGADEDEGWWGEVEELVLDRQHIRRLQNLERLTKMRKVSFCDNELTRVEGLGSCTHLEELSLEDNRILTIEGLEMNRALKKLDLGKNKISRIENLDALQGLTQLSLEDNEISKLEGLACLASLMELYIGNNRIAEMRELNKLKTLPKLIILDLLGNPLCELEDYRHFTIYHLKKLKVLDGAGVEAEEQTVAKQKYAGRLTLDFIEERIGHRFFEHLRELEIHACKLRDIVGAFAGETFAGLTQLDLSNNHISQVDGVRHLPNLTTLILNNNRLAEAFFIDPTEDVNLSTSNGLGPHWGFPKLECLHLGGNRIHSVAALGLAGLVRLKQLYLHDNNIQRLNGFHNLPALRELSLNNNRIKYLDAKAFLELTSLKAIYLEENGLKSLSHIDTLKCVQRLHIGCNRLTETADLDRLAELPELTELVANNNPIARKQAYKSLILKNCPHLVLLDSKEITPEEREQSDMLFATGETPAASAQPGLQNGVSKVPIKLTSMNFEHLLAYQAGAGVVMPLGDGLGVRGDKMQAHSLDGPPIEVSGRPARKGNAAAALERLGEKTASLREHLQGTSSQGGVRGLGPNSNLRAYLRHGY